MRRFIQFYVAIGLAALLGAMLAWLGPDNALDNMQYDLVLAQNSVFAARSDGGAQARVAIVAVDERSLSKFGNFARIMLAPKWASLIEGLTSAGAKAIGFDIIFAYPDAHFEKNWERPFLRALAKHRDKIVLARSERLIPASRFQAIFSERAPGQRFGANEIGADADNIHRTVRAHFQLRAPSGKIAEIPTLSNLLLQKAGRADMPERVRIAPKRALEALPAYSLWDVLQCAERGETSALARAFSGKVVLIGTTLTGEDRFTTADRFMPRPVSRGTGDGTSGEACSLVSVGASDRDSSLVPGVYLHAEAVNSVLQDRVLRTIREWLRLVLAALLIFAATWAALLLRPLVIAGALAAIVLVLHLAASLSLGAYLWLPGASISVAVTLGVLASYLVRYLMVDRQRRAIRRAFKHYVSEQIVDRLVVSETAPVLGGERRDITIMFADLSGFTALSEKVSAEKLTQVTNDYFSAIVREVEAAGGYVDKFIGDCVMAFWGAPGDDEKHAIRAVRAALEILRVVDEKKIEAEQAGEPVLGVKVAINTGEAIVGNVGTETRLNYTAVGRPVNIAARIEGLLSAQGTDLLLGEETASRIGGEIALRQVGEAHVKGIGEKIKLFVPEDFPAKPGKD